MMAASLPRIPGDTLSCAGRISHKKAQKAQKEMQESNHRSALVEKLLQPGERNVRDPADINRLCDIVRETSFEIHKFFRSGQLEKTYENAFAHRLTKLGIQVTQQHPLEVFDEDGTCLSHLSADLFVAQKVDC